MARMRSTSDRQDGNDTISGYEKISLPVLASPVSQAQSKIEPLVALTGRDVVLTGRAVGTA